MGIAPQTGSGQQGAIDQGGVIEPVLPDGFARAGQGLKDAQVGHVAGREEQSPFAAQKIGQFLLQGLMGRAMTSDQMGRAAADAIGLHPPLAGGDHLRMAGQAQIIVGAEGNGRTAIKGQMGTWRRLDPAALAIEMGRPPALQLAGEVTVKHGSAGHADAAIGHGQAPGGGQSPPLAGTMGQVNTLARTRHGCQGPFAHTVNLHPPLPGPPPPGGRE